MNERTTLFPLTILSFFAIACFYIPILGHHYAFQNDYLAFEYNVAKSFVGYPESAFMFMIGRPLQSVLLNMQFSLIHTMQSFNMVRLFNMLLMSAAASCFFLYLKKNCNINRYSAVLLTVLTFTLPSMTINSFWIAISTQGIEPIFLILAAHALFQKIYTNRNIQNHSTARRSLASQRITQVFIIVAVFSLLLISLLIYPPTTFFFLTLTLINFLFGPQNNHRAKLMAIFAETVMLMSTCAVFYLSIKLLWKPFLIKTHLGGFDFPLLYQELEAHSLYAFTLSFDVASKIEHLRDVFKLVFSAWFAPMWKIAIPSACLFTGILAWGSLSNPYLKQFSASRKMIIGPVLFIFLAILTALPMLATPAGYPMPYRGIFASMTIVPTALVFFIDRMFMQNNKRKRFTPLVVITSGIVLAALYASYYRLSLNVTRLTLEYEHVLDVVRHQDIEKYKEVRVPPFNWPKKFNTPYLYGDFGWTGLYDYTSGMVHAAVRETHRDLHGYPIRYDTCGPFYEAKLSDGIQFQRDGYPTFLLRMAGFSGTEDFGRWTDGEEAVLEFVQPLPKKFTLKFRAGLLTDLVNKPIDIIIGTTHLTAVFNQEKASDISLPVTTNGHAKSIVFKFHDIKSPKEMGLSADPRHLGLAMVNLQIID